jgi:hypothetical protein
MNGASLVEETKVFWPRVLYTSVNYNGFEGSKFESYVGTDVLKKKKPNSSSRREPSPRINSKGRGLRALGTALN